MKSLVFLDPTNAEEQWSVRRQTHTAPNLRGRARIDQRLTHLDVHRVRHHTNLLLGKIEMLFHWRHENPVGGNHTVSRSGATAQRDLKGPISDALQPSHDILGRPEFFEPLGIEDERHTTAVVTGPRANVAQTARTEPMHDVYTLVSGEPCRHAAGPPAEPQIGGVPVGDRRAPATGEWKRPVRNVDRRQRGVLDSVVSTPTVGVLTERRRRPCDQRDRDISCKEIPNEIEDMAFESPIRVEGIDAPGENGDASWLPCHDGMSDR